MKATSSILKILTAGVIVLCVNGCLAEQPQAVDSGNNTSPSLTASLPDAPDFELVSLTGGTLKSADLAGKVVVLDFWATWCAPCIEEIPNYNALHREQDSDKFQMVGVTVESGPIEDIRPFVDRFAMEYPVVMGDQDVVSAFGGIPAYPITFVISPDWKIFKKYIGQFPPDKKAQIERDVVELTTAFDELSALTAN